MKITKRKFTLCFFAIVFLAIVAYFPKRGDRWQNVHGKDTEGGYPYCQRQHGKQGGFSTTR